MSKQHPFNIEIDKLTRSIENAITGDSFKTQVLELTAADIRKLKKQNGFLIGKRKQISRIKKFTSSLLQTMQTLFKG